MQPRDDECFTRLDLAADTFAETALCAQGDKRRLGVLPVALFERRLDGP
jgi:hypothetical protein